VHKERAVLDVIANSFVKATEAIRSSNEKHHAQERDICAKAAELLQRAPEPLIVVNEYPYTNGASRDRRVDMRIWFGPGWHQVLWLEFKPLLDYYTYWTASKFSVTVKPDIEKVRRLVEIRRDPGALYGFAVVVDMNTELHRREITPDVMLKRIKQDFEDVFRPAEILIGQSPHGPGIRHVGLVLAAVPS